jgi:PhoU domain
MLGLRLMVEQALRHLKDELDAFAERNSELALNVWRADQQIDALHNSVFRELLTYMMEYPARHRSMRASVVRRQEPGTDRRPYHQRRRDSSTTSSMAFRSPSTLGLEYTRVDLGS